MTTEIPQTPVAPESDKAAHAAPLWKKVIKVALYTSSALIAPLSFRRGQWPSLSWGKMAIFVGVPLLAMPMSAKLFPTAEEVLEQKGYPVAMVQDLASDRNNIRVRPDNAWGKAQALLSTPLLSTIIGKNKVWDSMRDQGVLGLAQADHRWSPDVIFVAEDRLRDLHKSGHKPRRLSYEDEWLHAFLHEVRHVSAENRKLGTVLAREADSDYQAARVLIKHLDRPFFQKQFMAYKGGSFPDSHDTALYLSARFNGTAVPTPQDMAGANRDAGAVLDRLLQKKDTLDLIGAVDCHLWETPERPCRYTLDGAPLSGLAKQRLGMYFNSMLYAVPDISVRASEVKASSKAPKPTS